MGPQPLSMHGVLRPIVTQDSLDGKYDTLCFILSDIVDLVIHTNVQV